MRNNYGKKVGAYVFEDACGYGIAREEVVSSEARKEKTTSHRKRELSPNANAKSVLWGAVMVLVVVVIAKFIIL